MRKSIHWLSPLLSLLIRLGLGRSGLQTTNDFDAVAAEVRENEKNDTVKGTQEGVSGGATDVEDVCDVVQDTGVRVIDSAQVTLKPSTQPVYVRRTARIHLKAETWVIGLVIGVVNLAGLVTPLTTQRSIFD